MLNIFTVFLLFIVPSAWGACTEPGTICSPDCTGILLCPANGANPIKLADCDPTSADKKFCKEGADGASCSTDTATCEALTAGATPVCGAYGEFPHPTECNTKIRCNNANGGDPLPGTEKCNEGEFVDPNTYPLQCTKTQPKGCPVDCSANETGKIGIYCYECMEDDKILLYSECGGDASPTTSPTPNPTGTNTPNTPTPTPKPTPTPTPSPPPTCSTEGEIFPHPTDCHSYYWCNAQLKPELKRCSSNRYFYKPLKRCVDGTC